MYRNVWVIIQLEKGKEVIIGMVQAKGKPSSSIAKRLEVCKINHN